MFNINGNVKEGCVGSLPRMAYRRQRPIFSFREIPEQCQSIDCESSSVSHLDFQRAQVGTTTWVSDFVYNWITCDPYDNSSPQESPKGKSKREGVCHIRWIEVRPVNASRLPI